MMWTIAMGGVAVIFWVVSIAARIETSRLRKLPPGNTLDKQDVEKCVAALLEIREIDVPSFAGCAGCKSSGQSSAWRTTRLASFARHTASTVLREITTPVKCEFCNEGFVACSASDCYGGNTRDGGCCRLCQGSGAIRCEDCDGRGEC